MQPVKEYTFDNFIVGKSTQFAFTAAKAVADKPGETYNPLLICGESGLGKTHLLDAIYNQVSAQLPDASISIFTADELIKMMVRTFKAELEKMCTQICFQRTSCSSMIFIPRWAKEQPRWSSFLCCMLLLIAAAK